MPIRILTVDDHPLLREGIAAVIEGQPDMQLVGEAASGLEALQVFRDCRPDVTLMDLQMPGMGGVEAIGALHREFPDAKVVVLTTYQGDAQALRAFKAGAAGYLLKSMLRRELVLVAPRATLDPARAGWDERHRIARRINFRNRYGYAPDMTESASRVWLIHDPLHRPDAMHAALFQRPWVTNLYARYTGEGTEDTLREMRVLDRILEAAMDGKFSPSYFAWLWRGRRSNGSYLRAILASARLSGHRKREIMICRSVTQRLNAPRFARRLEELTGGG